MCTSCFPPTLCNEVADVELLVVDIWVDTTGTAMGTAAGTMPT